MRCMVSVFLALGLLGMLRAAEDDFSNHEANQKIIQYYEKAPDQWPKDQLLKVAICYAVEQKLPQAEQLYMKVLEINPNEARALRGLGNCWIFKNHPEEAAKLYEKGWALGDVDCLRQLTSTYMMLRKPERIKALVPDLLKNKDKSMEIVTLLLVYSLNADPLDRETFFKALAGIPDEAILKRKDTTSVAITGLEKFGELERANKLRKAGKL